MDIIGNLHSFAMDNKKIISLIDEVDKTSSELLTESLEAVFNKAISHLSYQNKLMSLIDENEYEEHIEEHNKIMTILVTLLMAGSKSKSHMIDEVESFKEIYNHHISEYDDALFEDSNEAVNIIKNSYNQFGCIIVVAFEYGYFNKAYGEINNDLMTSMIEMARNIRNDGYFESTNWGEIIDIRKWKLLTQPSLDTAKRSSADSHDRNKDYIIYVTGESSLNEFVTESISSENVIPTYKVKNNVEAFNILVDQKLELGKIIKIECIGNFDFLNV